MKNGTHFAISIITLLLGLSHGIYGLDEQIVLGRDDGWQDFIKVNNLVLKQGKWGFKDYCLKEGEYRIDSNTDLLLHFNSKPLRDASGYYRLLKDDILLSERFNTLGEASGGFSSTKGGISLYPAKGAMFAPGSWWEDFSIEFWLYPTLLNDGEVIFSWLGSRWQGGVIIPQKISSSIKGRKVIWRFQNFFVSGEGGKTFITLKGITPLIPKTWHHHLIRYESESGQLEYLVDGIPEAVTYITESGREGDSLYIPHVGAASLGSFDIGENFTGFMDEFRISKGFEENPILTRYSGKTGVAISRVFDLGYTGTKVKRIESVFSKPADTEVYFFYRVSDKLELRNELTSPWNQFVPGRNFEGVKGRFLQVMFELFPGGLQNSSPILSEMRIIYEPDLPPSPPAAVHASPGDGEVRLYWKKVNEDDIRGYLVYYGPKPGNYHGKGSEQGDSPIDVGNKTSIPITGLENGKLYYFAIVAYDSTEPPHRSIFSEEISSRPSGLFR